jgi:hypothetical protein
MTAPPLLTRLEQVKATGPGRWVAAFWGSGKRRAGLYLTV